MILIDTSAWIEFLRDTRSATCEAVDEILEGEIATCDAIRMEVLAGARDEQQLDRLRRLLARATVLPTSPADYDEAARLYRTCRRDGETIRRMIDCLIATLAIRIDVSILHADRDFEALARHTALTTHPASGPP
jgi:predicted nucleic acid-binding protein